jgi:hypothetical protein
LRLSQSSPQATLPDLSGKHSQPFAPPRCLELLGQLLPKFFCAHWRTMFRDDL